MATQELIDYIKEKRSEGLSDKKIRESLLEVGWQAKDVEKGFNEIDGVSSNESDTKLTGPLELLDKSLNATREKFWRYASILIVPVILLSVASFFLNRLLPSSKDVIAWLGQVSFFDVLLISFFVIALIVVSAWVNAALLLSIKFRSQNIGFAEICLRASKLLGRYIIVMILFGLVFFGGLIPFLLPALFFVFWLYFSEYVLVDEGIGGVKALVRSREYMRGREFGVLVRLLFSFAIVVPFVWVAEAIRIVVLSLDGKVFQLIGEIAANIAFVPAIILLTVFYFILYENLKALQVKKRKRLSEDEDFHNWIVFFVVWASAFILGFLILFVYLLL